MLTFSRKREKNGNERGDRVTTHRQRKFTTRSGADR
jgi:hypothetical protein